MYPAITPDPPCLTVYSWYCNQDFSEICFIKVHDFLLWWVLNNGIKQKKLIEKFGIRPGQRGSREKNITEASEKRSFDKRQEEKDNRGDPKRREMKERTEDKNLKQKKRIKLTR